MEKEQDGVVESLLFVPPLVGSEVVGNILPGSHLATPPSSQPVLRGGTQVLLAGFCIDGAVYLTVQIGTFLAGKQEREGSTKKSVGRGEPVSLFQLSDATPDPLLILSLVLRGPLSD